MQRMATRLDTQCDFLRVFVLARFFYNKRHLLSVRFLRSSTAG